MATLNTVIWSVIGSSLAGTKHVKNGAPCQDAHHWLVHESGVLIVAVADGAGSAALSQFGSSIAVRAVVDYLADLITHSVPIDQSAMTTSFQIVREAIAEEASKLGAEARALACTLCVVLIAEDFCIQANVGDSAAIFKLMNGEVRAIVAPFKGEYANETAFVTDSSWLDNLVVARIEEAVMSVMVATDGLMDWSLRGLTVTSSFVLPILNFASTEGSEEERLQQLNTFLGSPLVTSRVDDDVTLVLGHRFQETEPAEIPEFAPDSDQI